MKVFRNRFFIAIVAAAILIFTAQLLFSAYNYRRFSQDSADEALLQQSGNQGALLGEHLMFVAGQSLVSTSLLDDEDPDIASDDIVIALQDFLNLNTLVQGAGVTSINVQGTGIYAYKNQDGVKTVRLNAAESDAYFYQVYQQSLENPTSMIRWNSESSSLLGQTNIVSALIPIYSEDVRIGFSRLDISVDALQKYLSAIELGDSGYAFVARDKSDFEKYLQQSGTTESDTGNLADLAQQLAQEEQSGLFHSSLAGEEQNIAVTPIGATGLKMVFVLPRNEAYSGINTVLIQSLMSLFFSLLVFLLIFYVIMQRKIDTAAG